MNIQSDAKLVEFIKRPVNDILNDFQKRFKDNEPLKNVVINEVDKKEIEKSTGGSGLRYIEIKKPQTKIFVPRESVSESNLITSQRKKSYYSRVLTKMGFLLHEIAHMFEDSPLNFLRLNHSYNFRQIVLDSKKKNFSDEEIKSIINELSSSIELEFSKKYGKTLDKNTFEDYLCLYKNKSFFELDTKFTLRNIFVDIYIENLMPLLAKNDSESQIMKKILTKTRRDMFNKSYKTIKSGQAVKNTLFNLRWMASVYIDPRTKPALDKDNFFKKNKDWNRFYKLNKEHLEEMKRINFHLFSLNSQEFNEYYRKEHTLYSYPFNTAASEVFKNTREHRDPSNQQNQQGNSQQQDKNQQQQDDQQNSEQQNNEQNNEQNQEQNNNGQQNNGQQGGDQQDGQGGEQQEGDQQNNGQQNNEQQGQSGNSQGGSQQGDQGNSQQSGDNQRGGGQGNQQNQNDNSQGGNDQGSNSQGSNNQESGQQNNNDQQDSQQNGGQGNQQGQNSNSQNGSGQQQGNGNGEDSDISDLKEKIRKEVEQQERERKAFEKALEDAIKSNGSFSDRLDEAQKQLEKDAKDRFNESYGNQQIEDQKNKQRQNSNKEYTGEEFLNYNPFTEGDHTIELEKFSEKKIKDSIISMETAIRNVPEFQLLQKRIKEFLKNIATKKVSKINNGGRKSMVKKYMRGNVKVFDKFISFEMGDLDIFILYDNSGSMSAEVSGNNIRDFETRKDLSILFCYLIKRLFEPLNVGVDIKSFTTGYGSGKKPGSGVYHRVEPIQYENLQDISDGSTKIKENYKNLARRKLSGASSGTNLFAAWNETALRALKNQERTKKPTLFFTVSDGDTSFESEEERGFCNFLNNKLEADPSIKHIKLCIDDDSLVKYFGATVGTNRYVKSKDGVHLIKNGKRTHFGSSMSVSYDEVFIDGKLIGKTNDFVNVRSFNDIISFMTTNLENIFEVIKNNGEVVISNTKSTNSKVNKNAAPPYISF